MAIKWQKIEEGIRVRQHPERKNGLKPDMYFVLRYRVDGQAKQEALGWASQGWTLAKARAELAKLREAARTGEGDVTLQAKRDRASAARKTEAEKDTIATLLERYKVSRKGRPSLKTDLYYQKYFIPTLGDMTPEALRTAHVTALRQSVEAEGKAPATVKHVLCLLRSIIRYGAHEGLYDMPNVSRLRFKMPEVKNHKTECLTPEQGRALLDALDADPDQNLASLMRLALVTGMRKGALLGLKWNDIDFTESTITLQGEYAKNKQNAKIPLTAAARNTIEAIRPTQSPFVFPANDGGKLKNITPFLNRIRKAANLPPDFRPLHGLRHTYASWLASSGEVTMLALQELMTHKSPDMTNRYIDLIPEHIHKAASVIDSCLAAAANAEPARPQGAKVTHFTGKA